MSPEYAEAFEAGALAALDYITDERPDLEDVTMRAAEKIGATITAQADAYNARQASTAELPIAPQTLLPLARRNVKGRVVDGDLL
jgi:hypothetical protein